MALSGVCVQRLRNSSLTKGCRHRALLDHAVRVRVRRDARAHSALQAWHSPQHTHVPALLDFCITRAARAWAVAWRLAEEVDDVARALHGLVSAYQLLLSPVPPARGLYELDDGANKADGDALARMRSVAEQLTQPPAAAAALWRQQLPPCVTHVRLAQVRP